MAPPRGGAALATFTATLACLVWRASPALPPAASTPAAMRPPARPPTRLHAGADRKAFNNDVRALVERRYGRGGFALPLETKLFVLEKVRLRCAVLCCACCAALC